MTRATAAVAVSAASAEHAQLIYGIFSFKVQYFLMLRTKEIASLNVYPKSGSDHCTALIAGEY